MNDLFTSPKDRKVRSFICKNAANFVTSVRILCSAALLFFRPYSSLFLLFYFSAGFTDTVDGPIARKTHSATRFGERLDSVADFLFFASVLYSLIGKLDLFFAEWFTVFLLFAAKIGKAVFALLSRQHQALVPHSRLNKILGGLLFIWPLTFPFFPPRYSVLPLFVLAGVSTVCEWKMILKKKEETL